MYHFYKRFWQQIIFIYAGYRLGSLHDKNCVVQIYKSVFYLTTMSCFLISSPSSCQAQDRAVAVVYDNSGSMRDAGQCEGINYALQVMVGLLHPQDELFVFKMDESAGNPLSLKNKQQTINNASQRYDCSARVTPFDAAIAAQQQLTQSSRQKKWLIILSDGKITDKQFAAKYPNDLNNFVNQTGGRIIFLNVNKGNSVLDDFFTQTQTPNQTLKTQGSFEQVVETMEQIAGNIMTLSSSGVSVQRKGNQATLKAPIPLKSLIVLQQDSRKNVQLPSIKKATAQQALFIEDAYQAEKVSAAHRMKGIITHIRADQQGQKVIPKGEVTVQFDKDLRTLSNIRFLPEAAARLEVSLREGVKSHRNNNYWLCDTAKTVELVAQLVDLDGKPLDGAVLAQSKVHFINEGTQQKQALHFNRATKEFVLPISPPAANERLLISVMAEYAGFFNFQSRIFTLQTVECPVPVAFIDAEKTSINASVLNMDEAESITVQPKISVNNQTPRHPTPTELKALSIEKVNDTRIGIQVTEQNGQLTIQPTTYWCACFTKTGKDSLVLKLTSTDPNLKTTERSQVTLYLDIEDASWWAKCGWLLIIGGLFLVLLWYIWGIIKKPRFCRGAEIIITKTSTTIKRRPKSYPLPTGFFSRYLIPYIAEKQNVGSVTFKAGSRCSHILLSDKTQTEEMYISGFPIDHPGHKDLRLSNGEQLEINRRSGKEVYEYRKL